MRIIGGKWRGRKLSEFSGAAYMPDLRPTMDKVKETLFNIITHGISFNIEGSRVLDLFCGTGALGLEALSRGADHVSFVDNKKNSLGVVNKNSFRLNAKVPAVA